MTEPDDDSLLHWDEVVDVICVGTSPGVLAYGICCAANDLDVLMVSRPTETDEHTAAWFAAMTADLDPVQDYPGFSFARVFPPSVPTDKRPTVETFVGEHLRQWSAQCLHSPFGVVFTAVPDMLVPMRTADGESITAAIVGDLGDADPVAWLAERARQEGLDESENVMAAMILEEGRIAGVELADGYRVAARNGLVWPAGAAADPPAAPSPMTGLKVAVVGRPAGRFATVDLVAR